MERMVQATSVDNRPNALRVSAGIAVAAAIVGLSLAEGGYGGVATGMTTVLVWLLVLAVVLSGRGRLAAEGSRTVHAGGCLVALAGLTAFSLLWASDDGSAFADVVRISGYAGAFVLAGLTLGRGRGESTLVAIATGIFGVAMIALASRLGGIGEGDTALASLLTATSGRLSYPIGYWNGLGALMALGVPLLVWLAAGLDAPRARGRAIAALCPPLLVAYMTSSRGALLGAAFGAVVVVIFASDRPRAAAATVVGILATLPAFLAAGLMSGILDSAGAGAPGSSELIVALALVAGMAFAAVAGDGLTTRLSRIRVRRIRVRRTPALIAVLAIGVGLVLLTGPSRFIDDFRSLPEQKRTASEAGILTVSGSGRAQFWGTALDAFAGAPLKGVGAGGYGTYWNVNGTLNTPTKYAHSEPLELLAELGIAGFALFIAFFFVVVRAGIRRARGPDRAGAGAALGVIAAGSVGFLIDWTWQLPAVVVPILIAAALLTGPSFAGGTQAPPQAPELGLPRTWRGPVIATALIAIAIPAIWAGGVLGLATSQLNSSEHAYSRGEYGEAARSARTAAQIEPWASEPWLRLTAIEQAAGNLDAARTDGLAAIDRAPQDFRAWLLLGLIESVRGNPGPSIAYTLRAGVLAPQVLSRIGTVGLSDPGSGI